MENAYIHGIKPENGNGSISIETRTVSAQKNVEIDDRNGCGSISIETRTAGEDLEICVMDNGIGMNQDELNKIQQLLEGHDPGTKNEYNWQSIGMKNIHDRLKYLYGEKYGIQVTSTPHVGTIVCVRMPVIRGSKDEKRVKMIIADDEPVITAGIQKLVDWTALGIEIVGTYTDGKSALKGIIEYKPDIVLLDISMPEMTGVEILKKCHNLNLPSRIVSISGFQDFEYAKAGIQYGAVDFLLKPIIREELLHAVGKSMNQLEQEMMSDISSERKETVDGYSGLFSLEYENYLQERNLGIAFTKNDDIAIVLKGIEQKGGKETAVKLCEEVFRQLAF